MAEVSSKTHDLIEPDEIVVKAQSMFPNCKKYKKCCTDDKEHWDKLDRRVKELQPIRIVYPQSFRTERQEYIKKNDGELKPFFGFIFNVGEKPPEGFEDVKISEFE